MTIKRAVRAYRSITVLLIATLVVQSSGTGLYGRAPLGAQAGDTPTVPVAERTQAERLVSAPATIEISATSIQPEIVEITVGLTITLVNLDNRTRHIKLSANPVGVGYRVYLPLVLRGAGGLAVQFPTLDTRNAAPQTDEVITIAPGQQVQRLMPTVGDVYVSDADNAALPGATVLVTPLALETDGSVVGQVKRFDTKAPLADATIKAVATLTYTMTTDAQGHYTLPLPAGDYTLYVESFGFTFATRKITVQSFSPTIVDTIELSPRDSVVKPIGAAGGTVTNSLGNTNVVFASGAMTSTGAVRLTDLPVDEFTKDFSSLPGPFTDGKIPLGFVMFEPEGVTFSAPVTWTIAYTGSLPVGSQLACYYWIEAEARWGDPVPSIVVDLGNGKKGLQAVLPHFSIYGHGAPPNLPAPPPPPPNPQPDPQNNPNQPDNGCPAGSQINLMTGDLCQTVGTLGLPTIGNLPAQITAKYHSTDAAGMQFAMTLAAPTGQYTPDERKWRFEFAGRTFTGTGESVSVGWNGLDVNGNHLAPGLHQGRFTTRWEYQTWVGWQIYETPFTWTVSVRRPDLSPFGYGWFGPHDTLLLDRGNTVSIIQGDGRFVQFDRQGGAYAPAPGEFSTLAHQPDGSWTRTYPDGTVHTFNADGRLTRIADRYGNFQVILYESNGRSVPPGEWGLTTRIRRITDSSGNTFDYSYDLNGWLSSIADSAGRVYRYEHNINGHLTASIDPLGQRETFTYDAQGLMTSHTDRRSFTTQYVLDNRGRVVTRTWPTGTALNMTYTPTRTAMTTDRGTPLITTLDQVFNPVAYYNGVYTVTTSYNNDFQPERSNWPPRTTLYNARGNVIATLSAVSAQFERNGPFDQVSRLTTNRGDDTRYLYDAAGNVTQTIDALGQIYDMAYDAHGQLLSLTDPLGNVTTFNYNARGQISSLTDPLSRTFQLNYNTAGNLTQITNPKSQVTKYEYDALNRLTAMVDALNGRTSLIYNADGKLTRITDPTNRSINYTYDALNRLTITTYADGGVERFGYDGWGNTTVFTDARGLRTTWQYDAANRPIQKQTQNGPTVTYSYDDLDQLLGVNEGPLTTTVTYLSDTLGQPLVARQTASLPLSVTLNYDYGYGYSRQASGVSAANSGISTSERVTTSIDSGTSTEQPIQPIQIEEAPITSVAQTAPLPMTSAADPIAQVTLPDNTAVDDPISRLPYREDRRPGSPNSTIFVGGTLLTDTTWISTNVYVLNNSVVVANNVTLTLEAGTVVKGGFGRIIDVYGKLVADGTFTDPIAFTSPRDDAHGGDTNGDGDATTPAPGDWAGLVVRAGGRISRLNHALVGYAGTGITFSGLGVDTQLAVENSTFISNSQRALYLNLNGASGTIIFTGNAASGNAINGATIVGNITNALTLNGSTEVNLPFRLAGSLIVNPDAVLALTPGTIIKGAFGQIVDVYGTLIADGTLAQPIVFTSPDDDTYGGDTNNNGSATSPAPGNWAGITVRADGKIGKLNHALVGYAGTGITFSGLGANTQLAVENSIFISNSQRALYLNLTGASGAITLTGNSASGNAINAATIVGNVSNTLTLNGSAEVNLPFRLTGVLVSSLTVDPGAELVLTPGTIIKGGSGQIVDVYGALIADGTAAQPVVFTSPNDDTYGGDTNGDGDATTPAPNDWGGITVRAGGRISRFDHVFVGYAGTGVTFNGLGADTRLAIENSTFISNSQQALRLNLSEASGYITLTGNTASGNATNAASIVGTVSNTLTLNGSAEANLPFRLTGVLVSSLTVDPGAELVLTPGTIIKGGSGQIIDVYGTLTANGTAAQLIAFTSPRDDAHGGDTNGDGYATSPAANDWGGIRFRTNSTGQLSNFLIAYASNGLHVSDATVAATNGSFIAHNSYAINNTTPSRIVTATTNYWGAATGPTHSSNPGGAGQRVTNGVLFTPWAAASPLSGGGRLRGIRLVSNSNLAQDLRFTYDAIGQLTSLTSSGYSAFALDYTYDADGRLTARTPKQGSPLINTYRYDAASQLTQLAISNTTNLLLRESYTLDGLGNVSGVNSSRDGVITYTYDALNRLTGVNSTGFNANYGYDAAGNRTSAGGVTYTYDAGGRLISASNGTTYGYDTAGNLTLRTQSGQTTTFTWDTQNRLTRIDYPNATYSAYQYDDAGRRLSKHLPDGTLIYYVYIGLNLAQELDSSGNVLASYTYDGLDRPISMWRGGSTYFYLLDRLGSVVGLTDSNGTLVASYRYDPWGNLISSTGTLTNPFRFTSREFDTESVLYFYRARYYDPQVGRFVSRDPIGALSDIGLYTYVKNAPATYVDSLGLRARPPIPRGNRSPYPRNTRSGRGRNGSQPIQWGEGPNAQLYRDLADYLDETNDLRKDMDELERTIDNLKEWDRINREAERRQREQDKWRNNPSCSPRDPYGPYPTEVYSAP